MAWRSPAASCATDGSTQDSRPRIRSTSGSAPQPGPGSARHRGWPAGAARSRTRTRGSRRPAPWPAPGPGSCPCRCSPRAPRPVPAESRRPNWPRCRSLNHRRGHREVAVLQDPLDQAFLGGGAEVALGVQLTEARSPCWRCRSRPIADSSRAAFGLVFSSRPTVSPRRLRSRGARVVSAARSAVTGRVEQLLSHIFPPERAAFPAPAHLRASSPPPRLVKVADGLAGHQAALAGELVDDGEAPRRSRSGVSITIVTAGTRRPSCSSRSPCGAWSPWKPQMPRRVVAPLSPGRAQLPDDRAVERLAVVQGRLRGVDHELLPQRPCRARRCRAAACGGRAAPRRACRSRTRSSVSSGRRSRAPSSGSTRPIRSPAPTAMIIIGTSALRPKKRGPLPAPCAVPSTPSSAVAPAMPRRCSRSQTATKAGHPVDPLLAAEVDGQLGRLVQVLGQHGGPIAAAAAGPAPG